MLCGAQAGVEASRRTSGRFVFLGTGSSWGTPRVNCYCERCVSSDPRDRRLRASACIFMDNGPVVLIDCGPDFRKCALSAGLRQIDAVLLTHQHADHLHGIEDLLEFVHRRGIPVTFYTTQGVVHALSLLVPGLEKDELVSIVVPTGAFEIGGTRIVPIPALHGKMEIYGWRVGDVGYVTDGNVIPEESMRLMDGVRLLVLTGFCVEERYLTTQPSFRGSFDMMVQLRPRPQRFLWTHMCDMETHAEIELIGQSLREAVDGEVEQLGPAYDGLALWF